MTQRFGGLFSPLNQREMTQFYEAVDFAVIAGSLAGDLEEYEEEIKRLESQPLDILIEIAETAKGDIDFAFFHLYGPSEGRHKELAEEVGPDEYWSLVTKARLYMVSLSKITKKLKKAQNRLQNEALD